MNAMWCFVVLLLHLFLGQAGAKPSFVSRMIPHPHTRSPKFSHSEFSLARMNQLQAQLYGGIGTHISNAVPIIPLYSIEVDMPYGAYKKMTLNVGIDTRSSLFWVKCHPVVGHRYEPYASPYYRETKNCSCPRPMKCDYRSTGCMNTIDYKSGLHVYSKLGFDQVSFHPISFHRDSSPSSVSSFDSILLGCARKVKGFDAPKLDGLLGFGTQPCSILSQVGATQFSHCIGEKLTSSPPPNSIGDVLIVGDDHDMDFYVRPDRDSTPFSTLSYHYQVNLTGLSFGETYIDVDYDLRDTIFDLGASLNSLQGVLNNALVYHITAWMEKHSFKAARHFGPRICYEGNLEDIEDTFPITIYYFDQGAELELDKHNMFMQVSLPQRVCLNLIDPNYIDDDDDYSCNLVGQTFQKNQYIKYDLAKKRMFMTKVDCAGVIKNSIPGLI